MNKIVEFFNKNTRLSLFFVFFCIFFCTGLSLFFFNNMVFEKWDVVFGADIPRVFGDFWDVNYDHYRIKVHPLLLVTLQPLFHLINAFVQSKIAATLLVQSLISAVNVCLLYSIIKNFSDNKKISLIFSLIFGFSFSTLIFASVPENYVFGALFNLLLFYYASLIVKNNTKISYKTLFVLGFLLTCAFGITPILIFSNLAIIIWLFYKKIKSKKEFFVKLLTVLVFASSLFVGLTFLQKLSYPNSPIFFKGTIEEDFNNYKINFTSKRVKQLIKGQVEGFYALKIKSYYHKHYDTNLITFSQKQNKCRFIPIFIFLCVPFLYYLKNYKKNSNNDLILTLFLIIVANVIFCYFYSCLECFLFSQNFFSYIVIMLALILSAGGGNKGQKFFLIFCLLFLLTQLIFNFRGIYKVSNFLAPYSLKSYSAFVFLIYSVVSALSLGVIGFGFKKLVKKEIINTSFENKYFIFCSSYLIYMLICAIFIAIFHGRSV